MTRAHECEREIMDIFPDSWFFSVRNHLARSVITLHDDNLHWALHTRASFVTLKHFHVTREPKSNLKFWIFSSVSRLSAFLFLCCIVRGMSRLKKILLSPMLKALAGHLVDYIRCANFNVYVHVWWMWFLFWAPFLAIKKEGRGGASVCTFV